MEPNPEEQLKVKKTIGDSLQPPPKVKPLYGLLTAEIFDALNKALTTSYEKEKIVWIGVDHETNAKCYENYMTSATDNIVKACATLQNNPKLTPDEKTVYEQMPTKVFLHLCTQEYMTVRIFSKQMPILTSIVFQRIAARLESLPHSLSEVSGESYSLLR